MNRILLFLLLLLPSVSEAQPAPDRDGVLATMVRANDYFMRKYADPTAVIPYYARKKCYESNLWTRAVYYEGLMALYAIHPENRYYDYACCWADFHRWGMRRDDTTTRNADNYCCAQTYIDLYRLCPEPERLRKTASHVQMLLSTPQVGDWTWIDAVQMGMPVLVKFGALKNDPRCFEKAWQMYAFTRNELAGGLYNERDGLWWRDAAFVPPYTTPNGKSCYWSRGNGWIVVALVRVLSELPADDPHRATYEKDLRMMCAALKKCQRPDGFWNVSLADPDDFGGKELTGTALFVYGMAWGVNNGLLERTEYLPVIVRAWEAMAHESVQENGFLGYVQGTGKEPKDGQPVTVDSMPDFEDYGLGCLLLAGSEVYKL